MGYKHGSISSLDDRLILKDNLGEVPDTEVRPERLDKVILSFVCLVEEEVTQADFIASPYENVWLAVKASVKLALEILLSDLYWLLLVLFRVRFLGFFLAFELGRKLALCG